jgi:hypothetical protein
LVAHRLAELGVDGPSASTSAIDSPEFVWGLDDWGHDGRADDGRQRLMRDLLIRLTG